MVASKLWYKSAILYQVDVATFCDSDGDGWGDFKGLTSRLDYIASLGVTCIWLKPFFTTPYRDGGYDVSDYYAVDPRLGTMGDFTVFLEEAEGRGLAVITELVANHTSIDHPWFVEASASKDSPRHDFYIWADEPAPPEESPKRITFSKGDTGVWTRNDATGEYYLHRFYPFQPDLNNANPVVQEEMSKVVAFLLRLGVAGLRLDAAPYVAEKAAQGEEYRDKHHYLRSLRRFLTSRRADAVLMAEADVEPGQLADYFGEGDGDEMNMLLNFLLSEYLFLAFAEQDASALRDLVAIIPAPPPEGEYANFLRNHDELDLEMLSEADRETVFRAFAPDEEMRVYGRGIRRRTAPMLDGDQARIRLANSLLFSMPGIPIVYYGDEIGMGDDLNLPERVSVRTPMQWSAEANGGFSSAEEESLVLKPISKGDFGFGEVNVADQMARPDSLLNWMRRLIAVRKEARAVGRGEWRMLDPGDPCLFGMVYEEAGDLVVVYHNLSDSKKWAKMSDLDGYAYLYDVFGDARYQEPDPEHDGFEINGFGYRWMRGRLSSPTQSG